MPYTYKKNGNKVTVYKKATGKVVGHTTTGKIKKYLAALHMHETNISEDSSTTKAAKIKAQQEKIKALQASLKDAQDELKKIQITPTSSIQEFSLAEHIKSLLEADGDTPEPTDTQDAEKEPAPDDKKEPESDTNLTVKFDMAKVKKYNSYPVVDNTGEVTGVSKDGLTVKVGDNNIIVNFEDLLT